MCLNLPSVQSTYKWWRTGFWIRWICLTVSRIEKSYLPRFSTGFTLPLSFSIKGVGGCYCGSVVELPLQAEMDRLEQLILKLLSEAGADDEWDTLWQIKIVFGTWPLKEIVYLWNAIILYDFPCCFCSSTRDTTKNHWDILVTQWGYNDDVVIQWRHNWKTYVYMILYDIYIYTTI